MGPEHNPRRFDGTHFIDLSNGKAAIEARLGTMSSNERIVLIDGGSDRAEIRLSDPSPSGIQHYIIRPPGVAPDMLAAHQEKLALAPDQNTVHHLSDLSVGGRFVAGTIVSVGDVTILLPTPEPEPTVIYTDIDPLSDEEVSTVIYLKKPKPVTQDDELVMHCATFSNGQLASVLGQGTRAQNQDRLGFVAKEGAIVALYVLDGYQAYGGLAAKIVAEGIERDISTGIAPGTVLSKAFVNYREQIDAHHPAARFSSTGTCAAVFEIADGTARLSHLGDTGICVLRPNDSGALEEKAQTIDHSRTQELIDLGVTDREVLQANRHYITRSVTYHAEGEKPDEPTVSDPLPLQRGDLIILYSDGIRAITMRTIRALCAQEKTPDKIIAACAMEFERETIEALAEGASIDNFSLVVFLYDPPSPNDALDVNPSAAQ